MKRKQHEKSRLGILLIVIALIAVIAVPVLAQYIKNSGEVTNTFTTADSVKPEIIETFVDNAIKKDVYFKVGDTGYPVYVRAAIVITWQDKDGTVYFSNPTKDTDYTLDLNSTDWEKRDDGFYYYKESIESGGKTTYLINECKQKKEAPADGYTLSVEIIVQTVQAVGSTDGENGAPEIDAWEDAWGIS